VKLRLPLGRSAFFLAAFMVALVALLPLRLALEWFGLTDRGLSAREAKGSVWLGALAEAHYGSVPVGDVGAELRTLPLLLGRARVDLARIGPGERFRAAATAAPRGFGFEDVDGSIDLGAALAPLPVRAIDLSGVTARFADGVCAGAGGTVEARLSGAPLLPARMTGTARCDGGALLLPLSGPSGMEALNLRIRADGSYTADLMVRPPDDAARDALAAAGFAPVRGGYAARLSGAF
jgi:general secretion pathway protein N